MPSENLQTSHSIVGHLSNVRISVDPHGYLSQLASATTYPISCPPPVTCIALPQIYRWQSQRHPLHPIRIPDLQIMGVSLSRQCPVSGIRRIHQLPRPNHVIDGNTDAYVADSHSGFAAKLGEPSSRGP